MKPNSSSQSHSDRFSNRAAVQSPPAQKANPFLSPNLLLKHTVIAAFVAGPLLSLPALAVDYTWGGGTGNWNATNWTPGPVTGPITAGNTAIINSGNVTVNVVGLSLDLITIGSGATLNTFNFNVVNTYGTFNLDMKGGTFTGNSFFTTFGSGVLKSVTASGAAASTISPVSSGAFNLTGTGAGASTFNVGDVTGNTNTDLTVSAPLWNTSGGTSDLTKTGAGTLLLSVANTYSGVTRVNEGTLSIQTATSLGTTAGNTIVASGATVYKTGGSVLNIAEAFNISGTGVGGVGAIRFGGGSASTLSGAVTLGENATIGTDGGVTLNMTAGIVTAGNTLTLAPTGAALNINTVGISGANGAVITSGTVNFNAANSYTGGTTVSAGTLTLGTATTALGSTSGQLTVNGGTLNLAGNSITVGNLTGTGGVISGTVAGTPTLTIGQGDTGGGNFLGAINNGTGTTALTKTGTGTITLSGTNGYTGATKVSGGTLVVNNTIGSSATTVETTGVLTGTGVLGSSLTVKSTGVVNAGTVGTISTTASVTGATSFESGSIFSWDLSANGLTGDKLTTGSVTGSDAIFRILLADGTAANAFFDIDRPNFFADTNIISSVSDLTALFSSVQVYSGLNNTAVNVSSRGSFFLTSSGVSWTAVPEPTSALAGLLLGAGLLRRRRN